MTKKKELLMGKGRKPDNCFSVETQLRFLEFIKVVYFFTLNGGFKDSEILLAKIKQPVRKRCLISSWHKVMVFAGLAPSLHIFSGFS